MLTAMFVSVFVSLGTAQAVLPEVPRPRQVEQAPSRRVMTEQEVAEFADDVPRKNTPGLVLPTAIKQVNPKYEASAMRERITGMVVLVGIVDTLGRIRKMRVLDSLDSRLDQKAMDALAQWEFDPAKLNGTPSPCFVQIQMEFRLR